MCDAIKEGLADRKVEREKEEGEEKPVTLKKGRKAVTKIIVEDDEDGEVEEKKPVVDEKIADLLANQGLIDEEEI
jgi:hypothetical protein